MKYTESYFRKYHLKGYKNRNAIFDVLKDMKPYRVREIALKAGIGNQQHLHPILNEWIDLGVVAPLIVNNQKMVGTYKMTKNIVMGE